MNAEVLNPPQGGAAGDVIKLAVLAVGGQGGGVLTGWIETLARAQGYQCQATSVAGVAQRTGATIYYIEMAPPSDQAPVFALAPTAGDVDVMIAAELMEIGRAIMRGFVTPDRTTLIGSTHRALAVSEKIAPGDGIAKPDDVLAAAEIASNALILGDMDQIALDQGSVISSSLFGALAGSAVLPFTRDDFEAAIRQSGKSVDASLRGFAAGFDLAQNGPVQTPAPDALKPRSLQGSSALMQQWQTLLARVGDLPVQIQPLAAAGLEKLVDFQDITYGATYLDRLDHVLTHDTARRDWVLTQAAAKHIANAMGYDDIIKVADLKTRAPRLRHIRSEMQVSQEQALQLTEFFHPRAEEIVGLLPARMGARWQASERRMALVSRLFAKGRRLRTDRLRAFIMLHFLGGLKRYRQRTFRHAQELAHLETWLNDCLSVVTQDYELAVELINNRRLIKGYSDTHARAQSKFQRVMSATPLLIGRPDAADWMRRLRAAALQDAEGTALDGALNTIRSFV